MEEIEQQQEEILLEHQDSEPVLDLAETDINIIGMDALCRLCANTSDRLIPIYSEEGTSNDLATKMNLYLPVKVSENDSLPLQCCWHCATTVLAWHELIVSCVEADRRLRALETETETDSITHIIIQQEAKDDPLELRHSEFTAASLSAFCSEPADTQETSRKKTRNASKKNLNETKTKSATKSQRCQKQIVVAAAATEETLQTYMENIRHPFMDGCDELIDETEDVYEEKVEIEDELDLDESSTESKSDEFTEQLIKFSKKQRGAKKTRRSRRGEAPQPIGTEEDDVIEDETVEDDGEGVVLDEEGVVLDEDEEIEECADEGKEEVKTLPASWIFQRSESKSGLILLRCASCDFETVREPELFRHAREAHSDLMQSMKRSHELQMQSVKKEAEEDIESTKERLELAKKERRKNTKLDQDAVSAAKITVDGRVYYHCQICGKNLHSPYTYIWHNRIHTGERPFVCDLCGKQFRVSQGLVRHLRETHQGVKNFPCDICGRMFATRRNVEEHRRIHTNERPYICDLCGKAFKQKASLFVHNRSHNDSFPFKCTYCNQGFRTRPPLLVHVTRHTGEKPYPCDVCGRCFRIKYELKRHRLIHSDEKPFSCLDCGISFRQKRYLRNHNKVNHNLNS